MNQSYWYINIILTKLFAAEERRLSGIISRLNTKNKQFRETKVDGFIHAGLYYVPKDAISIRGPRQTKTALHLSLIGEMESFLGEANRVKSERKLISQALFNLLSPCTSLQDVRNALPECLVSCVPDISKLNRTDIEAYTIQDKPRELRQYKTALLQIEVYVATQLLY
jgi:hypothetical protein